MLTFRDYYVSFPPQFGAPKTLRPGADVPPSYATVRSSTLLTICCCWHWNATTASPCFAAHWGVRQQR